MKIEQGDVMQTRMEWGSGFGTGFGAGNMKQDEYQKHETHGGTGSGPGDEQISRNDKAGVTDRTELGQKTVEGCTPDPKLGQSLEGDLGRSRMHNWKEKTKDKDSTQ